MASDLVVPVVTLQNVRLHTGADKLELCDVLGYQMCVPKGQYKSGDIAVYFPADTVLPDQWSEKFAVKNFLKGPEKNRVGRVRLRGEPSFGLVVPVQDCKWVVGENVAEFFGAQKYLPPVKIGVANQAQHDAAIDPFFSQYTDIQNGRIFVEVFKDGEEIVATEKIHGRNNRTGIINGKDVAGSHTTRKNPPEGGKFETDYDWFPWSLPEVCRMLRFLANSYKVVILYGEVFGGSVQKLNYGVPKGKGLGFRAFDLSVDGRYLSWDELVVLCVECGPYSMAKMKELADGKSVVEGADNIREGIVVKPVQERLDPKVGRATLKYVGTEYELGKKEGDDSTDV